GARTGGRPCGGALGEVAGAPLLEGKAALRRPGGLARAKVRGEGGDWICSSAKEQILAQPPLLLGKRRVALELLGVDERHIQSGLGAVVKKDGVEHLAPGSG